MRIFLGTAHRHPVHPSGLSVSKASLYPPWQSAPPSPPGTLRTQKLPEPLLRSLPLAPTPFPCFPHT